MPAIPPPPKLALPEGVTLSAPPEKRNTLHAARFLREVVQEYERRKCEALKIYTPFGPGLRLHQSQLKARLCLGSNRSGKSVWGAVEDAWFATGTHPYRKVPKENGVGYLVGWDQEFIGKVMAPKLLREGAFQIIRDEHTRAWRPVVPDDPYDAANREKWRNAPPILPPRFIKSINWESKKDNVPRDIFLANGTVLTYYSSKGAPQKGNEIDFAHIDEEIENKDWPRELQRGLVKRSGGLIYTATPQSSSPWLYNTYQDALEKDDGTGKKRQLADFAHLHVKENKYISLQDRLDFRAQLQTDDEVRVCWDGEFKLGDAVVYKAFKRSVHVIDSFDPPPEWNRWLSIDPGVRFCAVTFWGIPPLRDKDGNPNPRAHERHVFDTLLIKDCNAAKLADALLARMGKYASGGFIGFILDWHMGRQTQMGVGVTVEHSYYKAFEERGIRSARTGHGFQKGSDNIEARTECLKRWFAPPYSEGDTPILRIHDKCARLLWELPRQFYKQDASGLVLDQRVNKDNDAVTTAEYFAEADPYWIPPPPPRLPVDPVWEAFKKKQAKQRRESTGGGVSLGPPA